MAVNAPIPEFEPRVSLPASLAIADLVRQFDYAPLGGGFEVVDVESVGELTVFEVRYPSDGGSAVGTFIVPAGSGPFPGVLYQHGGYGTRKTFEPEARLVAARGAVALLLDAPFVRRQAQRVFSLTASDRDEICQLVMDWRRGIDLLTARTDVDPQRIAYVGHSYGSTIGSILAAVEPRLCGVVLMAGARRLSQFLGSLAAQHIGDDRYVARYTEMMRTIDPEKYIGRTARQPLLFQFGTRDDGLPRQEAEAFYRLAPDPKSVRWYDAGHDLDPSARTDRDQFLETVWHQRLLAG